MSIILSHKSALIANLRNRSFSDEPRHCFPLNPKASEKEIERCRNLFELGKSMPDILTTQRKQRFYFPDSVQIHYAKNLEGIPSFIRVGDIYVASPELLFVQVAATVSLTDAILFGYYLCGDYRSADVRKETGNQPLTSANKIAAYLEALPQMKGTRNAARALRYVIDNSNSPQESRLTIILILPNHLGGYGLLAPALNQPIPGTTKIGDLCWLEHGLVLEYDSAKNHGEGARRVADSVRRTKIELQDFRVVSVEPQQTHSLEYLDELAALVARHLGQRQRIRTERFAEKQRALHNDLYGRAGLPF